MPEHTPGCAATHGANTTNSGPKSSYSSHQRFDGTCQHSRRHIRKRDPRDGPVSSSLLSAAQEIQQLPKYEQAAAMARLAKMGGHSVDDLKAALYETEQDIELAREVRRIEDLPPHEQYQALRDLAVDAGMSVAELQGLHNNLSEGGYLDSGNSMSPDAIAAFDEINKITDPVKRRERLALFKEAYHLSDEAILNHAKIKHDEQKAKLESAYEDDKSARDLKKNLALDPMGALGDYENDPARMQRMLQILGDGDAAKGAAELRRILKLHSNTIGLARTGWGASMGGEDVYSHARLESIINLGESVWLTPLRYYRIFPTHNAWPMNSCFKCRRLPNPALLEN